MRIQEVVIEGVFGCDEAERLRPTGSFYDLELPGEMSVSDIQGILLSLLYPDHSPPDVRAELYDQDEAKLAVVLESSGKRLRVVRKSSVSTLRLQIESDGAFETAANGREAVVEALSKRLGFPEFEAFACLNLWRADDSRLFGEAKFEFDDLEGKARSVAEDYRLALKLEAIDDRIKAYQQRVESIGEEFAEVREFEERLERARERYGELRQDEMTPEDVDLVREKDERLADFEVQRERLEQQRDAERATIAQMQPEKPWRGPLYWLAVVFGVGALGASVVLMEQYRPLSLLSVVGAGLVAWKMLLYYTERERVSVHQARLESIQRRLNQVHEEAVGMMEHARHLLIHAEAPDEETLLEQLKKAQKLAEVIEQMEARIAERRRDPEFRRAQRDIEAAQAELDALRERRAADQRVVESSMRLEQDLRELGVDPLVIAGEGVEREAEAQTRDAFARLKSVAADVGLFEGGRLQEATRRMWGKICGHVLGDRFAGVDLSASGALMMRALTQQQLDMWRRTRVSEARLVAWALALAIHVNIANRRRHVVESIWIADPGGILPSASAKKLRDVFRSAAKVSQLVLCREGV